jgi:urease accessory protein
VLLTPSGALFDGDHMCLEVRCDPDTDVTLTTAAATKLNRCDRLDIRFDLHVELAAGATFRYLPHELIPFPGARYRQRITADLGDGARAWLLEVVSAGTTGATFSYEQLGFETEVRHVGVPTAREHVVMTPRTAAQLRGHTHSAALFAFGSEWDRSAAAAVNQRLACHPSAGASLLPSGGILARAVGDDAHTLREHLLAAAECPDWLPKLLPP